MSKNETLANGLHTATVNRYRCDLGARKIGGCARPKPFDPKNIAKHGGNVPLKRQRVRRILFTENRAALTQL